MAFPSTNHAPLRQPFEWRFGKCQTLVRVRPNSWHYKHSDFHTTWRSTGRLAGRNGRKECYKEVAGKSQEGGEGRNGKKKCKKGVGEMRGREKWQKEVAGIS